MEFTSFNELNNNELLSINGGVNWWFVAAGVCAIIAGCVIIYASGGAGTPAGVAAIKSGMSWIGAGCFSCVVGSIS